MEDLLKQRPLPDCWAVVGMPSLPGASPAGGSVAGPVGCGLLQLLAQYGAAGVLVALQLGILFRLDRMENERRS